MPIVMFCAENRAKSGAQCVILITELDRTGAMKCSVVARKWLILLSVVLAAGFTTASGLPSTIVATLEQPVTGRSVKEPAPARSVGESQARIAPAQAAVGVTPLLSSEVADDVFPASLDVANQGSGRALGDVPPSPDDTTTVAPATTTTAAPQNSSTTVAPSTKTDAAASSPVAAVAPTTTSTSTTSAPRPVVTASPTTSSTTTTIAPTTEFRVTSDGRIHGGRLDGRSVADGLRSAQPGDVFLVESGDHQPLSLDGVHGASGDPIEIRAADPSRPPTFTSRDYTEFAGVEVINSSHITIAGIRIRTSLWGVRISASSNIALEALNIGDIGQEGVRIMDRSRWVSVRNSVISNTGNRTGTASNGEPFSAFGEGIYVGTGSGDLRDGVEHITIANNEIYDTSSEAIDIKAPSRYIDVLSNTIRDIRTKTSGAIVVHIQEDYSDASPEITISRNVIRNISTDSGYRDGVAIVIGSSAEIVGNSISNTQHYGIRIEDGGAQGGNIRATIRDNSFSGTGLEAVWQASDRASTTVENNSGA